MKVVEGVEKLGDVASYRDFWYWVGDPQGGGDLGKGLVRGRERIRVVGGVLDDDLSYEYDELAIVELDGEYYLVGTAGCSCPSPGETWRVDAGPCSIGEIGRSLVEGEYGGYTLEARAMNELLEIVERERIRCEGAQVS